MPTTWSLPIFPDKCQESWNVFAEEIEKAAESRSYISLYDVFKGMGNMSKEAGNFLLAERRL